MFLIKNRNDVKNLSYRLCLCIKCPEVFCNILSLTCVVKRLWQAVDQSKMYNTNVNNNLNLQVEFQ